jgi:hypothetical protein
MKANKKPKAKTLKLLRGVRIDEVNPEILSAYLREKGVKFAVGEKPEALLNRYLDWLQVELEKVGGADAMQCERCEVSALPDVETCPVCGDGADPDDSTQPAAEDEDEPEDRTSGVVTTSGEPVEPGGSSKAKQAEAVAELDRAVARIKEAINDGAASYWRIGCELRVCHDEKLYKRRIDPTTGKPKYRSWEAFAEAELEITGRHARSLISVATAFTENDVRIYGIEKLRLIANVPESARAKLLKEAGDMSKRTLAAKVVAASSSDAGIRRNPNRSEQQQETRKRATEAATEAREARRAERQAIIDKGAVTCVFQIGTVELGMEESGKNVYVAEEYLVNDVKIRYTVTVKGKKTIIKIERTRGS